MKSNIANKRKKTTEEIKPHFRSLALRSSFTLGKKAKPQTNPAIPPPQCPSVSEFDFAPAPAKRFMMIIRMTINNKMHLVCSSCCPLKAFQLTNIIERRPVKIPKSDVEAPTELALFQNDEKRFPPMLNKV